MKFVAIVIPAANKIKSTNILLNAWVEFDGGKYLLVERMMDPVSANIAINLSLAYFLRAYDFYLNLDGKFGEWVI